MYFFKIFTSTKVDTVNFFSHAMNESKEANRMNEWMIQQGEKKKIKERRRTHLGYFWNIIIILLGAQSHGSRLAK